MPNNIIDLLDTYGGGRLESMREIKVQEQKIKNLEVFIQRVKKYTTLKELTPYALRELVKGTYVEAPDKSSGKRRQKVHIEYDLVGYIPVDELLKAEHA